MAFIKDWKPADRCVYLTIYFDSGPNYLSTAATCRTTGWDATLSNPCIGEPPGSLRVEARRWHVARGECSASRWTVDRRRLFKACTRWPGGRRGGVSGPGGAGSARDPRIGPRARWAGATPVDRPLNMTPAHPRPPRPSSRNREPSRRRSPGAAALRRPGDRPSVPSPTGQARHRRAGPSPERAPGHG
jgi:hypothetical protein